MAAELEVVDVCPQLIPQDKTRRFYHGFITVCVRVTLWKRSAFT